MEDNVHQLVLKKLQLQQVIRRLRERAKRHLQRIERIERNRNIALHYLHQIDVLQKILDKIDTYAKYLMMTKRVYASEQYGGKIHDLLVNVDAMLRVSSHLDLPKIDLETVETEVESMKRQAGVTPPPTSPREGEKRTRLVCKK